MKKELRWRVFYGYNHNDYISIGEEYLERAKYAMISGKIFSHKEKLIQGKEIKRIEPDFRFYTGWYDSYAPHEAEDFEQIKRDVPTFEIEDRSRLADERVRFAIEKNQVNLLSEPDKLSLEWQN